MAASWHPGLVHVAQSSVDSRSASGVRSVLADLLRSILALAIGAGCKFSTVVSNVVTYDTVVVVNWRKTGLRQRMTADAFSPGKRHQRAHHPAADVRPFTGDIAIIRDLTERPARGAAQAMMRRQARAPRITQNAIAVLRSGSLVAVPIPVGGLTAARHSATRSAWRRNPETLDRQRSDAPASRRGNGGVCLRRKRCQHFSFEHGNSSRAQAQIDNSLRPLRPLREAYVGIARSIRTRSQTKPDALAGKRGCRCLRRCR